MKREQPPVRLDHQRLALVSVMRCHSRAPSPSPKAGLGHPEKQKPEILVLNIRNQRNALVRARSCCHPWWVSRTMMSPSDLGSRNAYHIKLKASMLAGRMTSITVMNTRLKPTATSSGIAFQSKMPTTPKTLPPVVLAPLLRAIIIATRPRRQRRYRHTTYPDLRPRCLLSAQPTQPSPRRCPV